MSNCLNRSLFVPRRDSSARGFGLCRVDGASVRGSACCMSFCFLAILGLGICGLNLTYLEQESNQIEKLDNHDYIPKNNRIFPPSQFQNLHTYYSYKYISYDNVDFPH